MFTVPAVTSLGSMLKVTALAFVKNTKQKTSYFVMETPVIEPFEKLIQ